VETNIIFVSVDAALQDAVEKWRRQDVKVLSYGSKRNRLVMHGGIDDAFSEIAETE